MNIACLIIGIDGWEQYTKPLIESINTFQPDALQIVIDNASREPYPDWLAVTRTERLCYSAAINYAARLAGPADWYVVLSNDVLCTGPFDWILDQIPPNTIIGPDLKTNQGWQYLEGWCVVVPGVVWASLGGWDENYQVSSWEDVDFSQTALERGHRVAHVAQFPFRHLDQRQRFSLVPDYWDSETANLRYFRGKHARGIATCELS